MNRSKVALNRSKLTELLAADGAIAAQVGGLYRTLQNCIVSEIRPDIFHGVADFAEGEDPVPIPVDGFEDRLPFLAAWRRQGQRLGRRLGLQRSCFTLRAPERARRWTGPTRTAGRAVLWAVPGAGLSGRRAYWRQRDGHGCRAAEESIDRARALGGLSRHISCIPKCGTRRHGPHQISHSYASEQAVEQTPHSCRLHMPVHYHPDAATEWHRRYALALERMRPDLIERDALSAPRFYIS